MAESNYSKVYTYADPYRSLLWETASGHAWDRLEQTANEFHRGEIDWATVKQRCDEDQEYLVTELWRACEIEAEERGSAETDAACDAAYDYDSQFDHYERFGRPAFPNEY